MFEKEADEYIKKIPFVHGPELVRKIVRSFCKDAFKDGAEFGYNKGKEDVKTTILKLRNCMNCKRRDTSCHPSCKDKGIVLCSHWEMKE